ncbi:MAG: acyl-CoA dehydrogenase family protein [Planctomycetes bacterium]|nr:acyl-CoA dehydrogenase family protein [Planctomycetota bacterium]
MDFTFSEEHLMIRDMVREFVDKEVRPLAAKMDQEKWFPAPLVKRAAELGLMGLQFPEEYGGAGAGETGYCLMLEEICRASASLGVVMGAHQSIGCGPIYLDGTKAQKDKYLVPLAKGEKLAAFALTEPGAGSDAANIATTAVKKGDRWVVNGSKLWVSNGSEADVVIVFAVTDKALRAHGGTTAFIVEKTFPGFKVGKVDDKMGIRGSHSCELFFEDMEVPHENVLGEVGKGFVTAMKTLDRGRLSLGAGAVGAAKECLDLALRHASQRVQFGEPINTKQAVQFMLADMAAEIYQMESIVYRTAWMCDSGQKFSRESALVKLVCSESSSRVVDTALQVHGGMGYMTECAIERMYRDARINRIFEGTNEIQRLVVAADLVKKGRY